MSDIDQGGDRLKAEEWDLSVGALVEDSVAEIEVIADFSNPAEELNGNSEDSTCEYKGAQEGGEIDPSCEDPLALSPKDDESDSELPDAGSLPELQAKGTARSRAGRRRTSKFCGVCSANRRNQWQARILMHGKVTHLGYFDTEESAARVYDIVSLSLHKEKANTNFPLSDYTSGEYAQRASKLCGLSREDLQRSLGVKPILKTSRYNGVSKKRGKWVAKVMIDKKLVYHASFEDEKEAALAYDDAVRRLKPNKAHAYVNFVEPLSTDEANLNNSYPSQQKQFVTGGQQPRMFPEPDMMMMGRSGDVTMSGTTPVNHWPQLLGRMAFLPTRTPETSMMMQQHPMVGNQLLFDHGTDGCQQAMPALNGQQLLYGPPPNLQQLPRLGNSMALSQTLGEASEQCWGQQVDTYGVGMEQQIPNINSQWPTWRGVSHVNGSMVGRSFNEDMMRTHVIPNQLPHPASQRPIMWEGAMGLVKMPCMDAMTCREPNRTQVQALVQGSSLESMMNMSQQSSGSNWSSQFSANPNLTDEGASSINFGSRGFMPCGWS